MSRFAPGAAPLGRPYWWEDAPAAPDLPREPPARAEVLVIGGGYTGLSAAIACADAGARPVVLDAGEPGHGASTRNGGMFGAHPRLSVERVAARFGDDVARGIYAEAGPAFDFTRGLIAREGIYCDFQTTGRIQLAWTRADLAAQRRLVANLRGVADLRMEMVERAELGAEIATGRYFGGIRFPDHAALHPAKFHAGLLAAALRRGVPVVRNCAVEGVTRRAGGFDVRTAAGAVRADKVILATNGYTIGAFGWFRRRVFPLPSFLIATEEIDPGLIARLAPGGRMMVETRARHSYFRASPDGRRILFGGRAAMRPIPLEVAAARLHTTMTEIWPELGGVRLTHCWSGLTGYSFAHLPQVGVHAGVTYAMGYSGSGVAMAPYLGAKAAWVALGDPRGSTAYAGTRLGARPFHPVGRPHFLAAADLWYWWVVDPRQDRQAARDRAATSEPAPEASERIERTRGQNPDGPD